MTEHLEKEHLWVTIRRLKCQRYLPAIREARQMLISWMKQHPGGYYSQDAGESMAMLEDALLPEIDQCAV